MIAVKVLNEKRPEDKILGPFYGFYFVLAL